MRKSWILMTILLLAVSASVSAEKNYMEDDGLTLPAVFTYMTEGNPYLHADDTGLFSGAAVAKLGTLSLSGWNTITDTTKVQKNYSPSDNPYVYQLYMATGHDGSGDTGDANYRPNQITLSYTANDGSTKMMTLHLCVIYNISQSNIAMQDISMDAWGSGNYKDKKNFALLNASTTGGNAKMYAGDTIDFYLVSAVDGTRNFLAFDQDLHLYGRGALKVYNTDAWRDVHRLSYRIKSSKMTENGGGRYVTAQTSDSNSLFSPSLIDGIHYNHQPGTPDPDVIWTLSFSQTSSTVSSKTNDAQQVAIAKLSRSGGKTGNTYAVAYSFTDSTDKTAGSPFAMKLTDGEETIPYNMTFTPHGTGYIEKGTEYVWYLGEEGSADAVVNVHNVKTGAAEKIAGTYSDTVTVTIKAMDSSSATANT